VEHSEFNVFNLNMKLTSMRHAIGARVSTMDGIQWNPSKQILVRTR